MFQFSKSRNYTFALQLFLSLIDLCLQLRDILTVYNHITANCFARCVSDLNQTELTPKEVGIIG